jgi:hypothetical protein
MQISREYHSQHSQIGAEGGEEEVGSIPGM